MNSALRNCLSLRLRQLSNRQERPNNLSKHHLEVPVTAHSIGLFSHRRLGSDFRLNVPDSRWPETSFGVITQKIRRCSVRLTVVATTSRNMWYDFSPSTYLLIRPSRQPGAQSTRSVLTLLRLFLHQLRLLLFDSPSSGRRLQFKDPSSAEMPPPFLHNLEPAFLNDLSNVSIPPAAVMVSMHRCTLVEYTV